MEVLLRLGIAVWIGEDSILLDNTCGIYNEHLDSKYAKVMREPKTDLRRGTAHYSAMATQQVLGAREGRFLGSNAHSCRSTQQGGNGFRENEECSFQESLVRHLKGRRAKHKGY